MADARSLQLIDRLPPRAWLWALGLGLLSATGFQPLALWPLAMLAAGGGIMLRQKVLEGQYRTDQGRGETDHQQGDT